jgi:YbbR domain-containing protein
LSGDYFATFNVPIKLVNFPPGYTTGTKLPHDVSVKLKGEGWKLFSVNISAESDYLVSVGDSGKVVVDLNSHLSDNQWLSSGAEVISITPDTLSFIVEKILNKKVKIIPDLRLNYKPGYGLATPVRIIPEYTTAHGPGRILKNLTLIPTRLLHLDNLDTRRMELLTLKEIPGMTYDDNYVRISLDIQKIVDKNFDNIPVEITDTPNNRNIILLPGKVNVGVRGGIDILAKLKRDKIKLSVNYNDIVRDTLGTIAPAVSLPENLSMIYLKPERLRYIIKKFK